MALSCGQRNGAERRSPQRGHSCMVIGSLVERCQQGAQLVRTSLAAGRAGRGPLMHDPAKAAGRHHEEWRLVVATSAYGGRNPSDRFIYLCPLGTLRTSNGPLPGGSIAHSKVGFRGVVLWRHGVLSPCGNWPPGTVQSPVVGRCPDSCKTPKHRFPVLPNLAPSACSRRRGWGPSWNVRGSVGYMNPH